MLCVAKARRIGPDGQRAEAALDGCVLGIVYRLHGESAAQRAPLDQSKRQWNSSPWTLWTQGAAQHCVGPATPHVP